MRIGIAITRASSVDASWTTIHLAAAALQRGHQVRFIEPWDYEVDDKGQLLARAHAFDPPGPPVSRMVAQLQHRQARRRYVDLGGLDLLLVRAAPLDPTLLAFAMLVQDRGVPVVNDPRGMLMVSHKAWLQSLPNVRTAPGIVTRSHGTASIFYAKCKGGAILKPARGSGGRAVARLGPRRATEFDIAFRHAADVGDGYVVVQQYLPAAELGEKRLVWLDGEVLGGYLRRRAPGEFRHNLKRGGQAEPTDVTPTDRAAVATLSPHLLAAGIRLSGLDLIGDCVIEVNALNPGGAFHTDRLSGTRLADTIIARFEAGASETQPWARPVP